MNYKRFVSLIEVLEASYGADKTSLQEELFSDEFLTARPLLEAMQSQQGGAPAWPENPWLGQALGFTLSTLPFALYFAAMESSGRQATLGTAGGPPSCHQPSTTPRSANVIVSRATCSRSCSASPSMTT